jgi:hypothetical protein
MYDLPEGFVSELGATVRTCVDCGCLITGGPTRCNNCADRRIYYRKLNRLQRFLWRLLGLSWIGRKAQ